MTNVGGSAHIKGMRKVFWDDPYQTTVETVTESVVENEVRLRDSVFFAFSGGQESDTGTIDGVPVRHARWEQDRIVYTMPEDHRLTAGKRVIVTIDWPRRYRLMRLHFAAEIVLEIVTRMIPEAVRIGAHISERKARLDFRLSEPATPRLIEIQAAAGRVIRSGLPVRSGYSDTARTLRFWEIPGFARVPCSGTHIRSTEEIGEIKLSRKNIGKGKERIEIVLFGDAPSPHPPQESSAGDGRA